MRDIAESLPEPDRRTWRWSLLYFRHEDRGSLAATVHLPRAWFAVFLDFAGALALFIELLLTPETFFACGGSIMSVLLYDKYGSHFSVDLTWIAVTLMASIPEKRHLAERVSTFENAVKLRGNNRLMFYKLCSSSSPLRRASQAPLCGGRVPYSNSPNSAPC